MLRPFARPAVVLCLGVLLLAHPVQATELGIQVRASDGSPAVVETAELLLVAWGETERIPLTFTFDAEGAVLHVPLDTEWLRSRWPRAEDMESAFIYLTGRDFVSLRSDPFRWLGTTGASGDAPRSDVTINFGQGQEITVREGETPTIVLKVRRSPEPKQLRFVDDEGRPVTTVTVSAYMLWSTSNRCGELTGKETLVEGVRPNAAGIVTLPDGDFPYAIEVFLRPHERVRDPDVDVNGVVETYLREKDRVIHIHRFTRQPLSLRVFLGTAAVAMPPFTETVRGNGCGARTGLLLDRAADGRLAAPAVRDGEVVVENFFPEEIEAVCLGDSRGRTIWTLSTFDGKPVTVRLPAGTRLGLAESCFPR
jgi:hypothetical protein